MKNKDVLSSPDEQKWRELMTHAFIFADDPTEIVRDFQQQMSITKHLSRTDEKEALEKINTEERTQRIAAVTNLERHTVLAGTTLPRYRPLIIEFSRRLIKEYTCRGADEKALVQLIASAYVRSIQYANHLNNIVSARLPISSDWAGMIAAVGKEIDRAQRQFCTGLSLLKQLKQPPIKVNIKSDNAFVAGQQEFKVASQPNLRSLPIEDVNL